MNAAEQYSRDGQSKPLPATSVAPRLLAAVLLLLALAACEHGQLSYNSSSGTFNLPFGSGSHQGD